MIAKCNGPSKLFSNYSQMKGWSMSIFLVYYIAQSLTLHSSGPPVSSPRFKGITCLAHSAVSFLLSILFNSPFHIYYQCIMVRTTCLTDFCNDLLLTGMSPRSRRLTKYKKFCRLTDFFSISSNFSILLMKGWKSTSRDQLVNKQPWPRMRITRGKYAL